VFFVRVMGVLFAFMIVCEFCGFNEKTLLYIFYAVSREDAFCELLRTLEDGRFQRFSGIKGLLYVLLVGGSLGRLRVFYVLGGWWEIRKFCRG
jgi:hypothetical protein